MKEVWKSIENLSRYAISNKGRIKNIKKNKILKQCIVGHYYGLCIRQDTGIYKIFYVHRLVAEAFIPNPNNCNEVNHIDENKLNNQSNNLEWCTHKYNCNFGTSKERIAKAQKGHICPETTRIAARKQMIERFRLKKLNKAQLQ